MRLAVITISVLSVLSNIAIGDQTSSDYAKYKGTVDSNRGAVIDTAGHFNPHDLPKYTDNPAQKDYYHGVDSEHSEIDSAGRQALPADDAGGTVFKHFLDRPKYKINSDSPAFDDSNLVKKDAYNITHGISDQYINCKKHKTCKVVNVEHTCSRTNTVSLTCDKTAVIHVTHTKVPECYHLIGSGNGINIAPGPAGGMCVAGFFTMTGDGGDVSVNRTYTKNITLPANLKAYVIVERNRDGGANVSGYVKAGKVTAQVGDGVGYAKAKQAFIPTTTAQSVTFHYQGHRSDGGGFFHVDGYVLFPYHSIDKADVTWNERCQSVANPDTNLNQLLGISAPPGCGNPKLTCTKGKGTQVIDGLPVTLNCWAYHEQYTCGTTPEDTCKDYEKTCRIGPVATCTQRLAGQCVKYDYTYECPTQKCTDHSLYCTNNVFCIDGKCTTPKPTQNKDFGQSASELAAVAKAAGDAAAQYKAGQTIRLFSGHKQECSYTVAGINNCCDESGWAHGILGCTDQQKKLANDYKHYLVTYVGDYCHNRVLGVCITKHKVYCVYDSKMARIIEEYGRDQIGKTYGDPEEASCDGMTLDEFQRLNFNVMDFIDPNYMYPGGAPNHAAGIAGDMSMHSPGQGDWKKAIDDRIKQDIDNNRPSADVPHGAYAKTGALEQAIFKQSEGRDG